VEKIVARSRNVRVITDKNEGGRILIVSGSPEGEMRVPLPVSRAADIVQETWRQNILAAGILLLLGLTGAALMAYRVTQPVRQLTAGAELLGRGEFGAQVPVSSRGEMGELQSTFNAMSRQLADLEHEKEAWQARAHLAELGGLARGLAHTLRNPLNALGLIIDQMVRSDQDRRTTLAQSARGQIRRVDGWLRSFLAVDADGLLRAREIDLHSLARDVIFEVVQSGGKVEVHREGDIPPVTAVAPALRSALANLVENAVEASPPEKPVRVELSAADNEAVIRVIDHGPGLPEEIRARLFTPHVTTKTGGAGMGIFLAKQLVEGGHGGRLVFTEGEGGGTVATVTLPLNRPAEPGEGES
jgi:signal transduction histidine kinase